MSRVTANKPLPANMRGGATALGNFDGVHLGHQAVLAAAAGHGAFIAATVFEPHPRRVFAPDTPPFRLQNNAQRARALMAAGATHVFEIPFDESVSRLTDSEFAEQILGQRLGIAHVSVGEDFHFGRARMGGVPRLAELGQRFAFTVSTAAAARTPTGERISSTLIREALCAGDLDTANALLTRPFSIEGVVERGFARGRALGFATANVKLGDYQRPKLGIYAVRADLGDGVLRPGVASLGVNPTFEALPEPLLEAHLFDFDGDLYGRVIEVELIKFLRAEAKFEDAATLARQIADDVAQARTLLSGL